MPHYIQVLVAHVGTGCRWCGGSSSVSPEVQLQADDWMLDALAVI